MTDDEPYSPFKGRMPGPNPPADVLWELRKAGHVYRAELRNLTEVQLFLDDEFRQAQRHPSRAAALHQAAEWRIALQEKGWRSGNID